MNKDEFPVRLGATLIASIIHMLIEQKQNNSQKSASIQDEKKKKQFFSVKHMSLNLFF